MKRYDSLRALFWVLAAGLSAGAVSAAEGPITATNNTGDNLTVSSENYSNIQNFTADGTISGSAVGTEGNIITLAPATYAPSLTLSGNTATLIDNFIFNSTGDGPMTLSFAPAADQTFTNTGSYTSTRQSDVLDIAGAAGATVTLSGDLSGFQSHLKHTSGNLSITGTTGVMTTGSGLLSIVSGAGTATLANTAARTVGNSTHTIDIDSGEALTLAANTGLQTISSKIQGAGEISVTGGQHLLQGSPINHSGGITVSAGELQFGSATNSAITTSGTGKLTFKNTVDGAYSGQITHGGSGGLEVDASGTVITLTNSSSGSPNTATQGITVTAGELKLEDYAVFQAGTYAGAGTVHFNTSVARALSAADAVAGSLAVKKSGAQTLNITGAGGLKTTGAVDIQAGSVSVSSGGFASEFLDATSDINVASGASMTATLGTSGLTLARPLTGAGTVTFDVTSTAAAVTLNDANIAVGTIALTGAPGTGFSLDITGAVPSSNITTTNSSQLITFSGASVNGEYVGAITGEAPVTVTSGANVQFSGTSNFGGALTVSAAGIAELAESAIKNDRDYIVQGASSRLKLNPTAAHTINSDRLKPGADSNGTIEILGGNTTATEMSFTTVVQSYNGKFELTSAYLTLGFENAISSAASTTLSNNSVLNIGSSVNQTINNLATASANAELRIGSGSTVTLNPTAETTFAGKIISTGGGIIHNSASNQILSGDLSEFGQNITTSSTGVLEISSSGITLGANTNTYTVNQDGTLKFSNNIIASIQDDFTLDGTSNAAASFDGATLGYLPTATGSTKTISGTGGMLVSTGGLTLTTDFGRSIINTTTNGLKANTGVFTKQGFGTFELSNALTTTYSPTATAVNVTAGTLKLVGPALAGAAGGTNADISIAAQSTLAMDLNNTSQTFARVVSGDGSIILSSTGNASSLDVLTLASTAQILNKGDMTIASYAHLNTADAAAVWQPGSAAKIAIENNGELTLGGTITPDGSVFNPYFVSGPGTINTHSTENTTITINSDRQTLLIGNTTDSLSIASARTLQINLAAGKRAELKYNLLAGGTDSILRLNSEGTLYIEGAVLDGYTGSVANNGSAAGQLWLKDTTINAATKFDFGHSSATTTFEVTTGALTLGTTNTLAASAGSVSKIGAGRLVFDATGTMSNWTGALNIYGGDVEFHKVSRGANDDIQVHKGARLVAWRDFGAASPTALTLGDLTLNSGATFLVTDRDWDTRTAVSTSTERSTVNLTTLATSAGAEITFVLDSAGASAGADAQTFSSAMISIAQDYSSIVSAITAPLYIRLAPALASADYKDNAVVSLIEFANANSATNFVTKIKLRPTVGTLLSSEAGLGTLTNGVSGKYAQLYIGSDRYLVAQINSTGFAPGLRPAAKTDFSATTYPIGTYTVTSFLENLMDQNFASYSALDAVLAAVSTHDRHFDYHMSLLSPASYQQASQMLHNGSMFLQPYAEQGVFAIAEQQRWAQYAQQDSGSNKLAGIIATLQDHQNLQSDTQVKSRGAIQSWDSVVSGMSFNDKDASHQMDARVVGLAWRLSPRAAIGYQHITSDHQYKALDNKTQGQKQSLTGQGFAQVFADNFSLQTLSSVSVYQNTHQRDMSIEVDEALIDHYSAHSTSTTTELSQSVTAAHQKNLATGISVDMGVKAQAQYAYTPKFSETGADNLSLVVESQHHAYVMATPTVALDLRQVTQSGWAASRFTFGYQKVVSQKNTFDYGFKDINARYQAQADQPNAQSGFIFGYQSCFANVGGLSLQLQYQTFAGQTHQGQVSVSYDF